MNPETLVEAVAKHLDAVESTVNWIILFAIAVSWAGIRKEKSIEAFGLTVERRLAFYVASVVYLIANMMVLILFMRLGDLLLLVNDGSLRDAVSRLFTHSWLLNPFSFFGDSLISRFHSAEGYGLLIATWWLCNTSMSTLIEDKQSRAGKAMLALFLGVGLLTMLAIQRTYAIVLERLATTDPVLWRVIKSTTTERLVGSFLGITVGSLFFTAANVLQQRWYRGSERLSREIGEHK